MMHDYFACFIMLVLIFPVRIKYFKLHIELHHLSYNSCSRCLPLLKYEGSSESSEQMRKSIILTDNLSQMTFHPLSTFTDVFLTSYVNKLQSETADFDLVLLTSKMDET